MKKSIIIISLLVIQGMFLFSQQKENLILSGKYFGQKPPGISPELFAPGIISRPDYFEHSAAIFSPDGKEVYWSAKPNGQRYFNIYFMKLVNGIWTERQVVSFCKEDKNYENLALSFVDDKLYFDLDGDIWFVERQNDDWSKPNQVSSLINTDASESICSISKNGSIYFTRVPGFDVYVARMVNGNYVVPEKLSRTINASDTREMSVYVALDESYMIIEASKDQATCELFISYKKKNNSWSERIKLPLDWARFPSVSPDEKYLFFMTRDGIFWVSVNIMEELKPNE